MAHVALSAYEKSDFSAPVEGGHTVTHDVYARGQGPAIVLMQELPGIGPETLRFADHLVDAGYSVVLPHLFGPLERISLIGNVVRVFCMRRELYLFAADRTSPIVDWLRVLCRSVRDTRSPQGVGVIGMCLTGNFAISLMADDSVRASVAAQPSMPIAKQSALHMSEADVAAVKQRLDETEPMLSFRFEGDTICQAAKFDSIGKSFNSDGTERIRLTTLPGKGHSVFTLHFVDEDGHPTREALDDVIAYFARAFTSQS